MAKKLEDFIATLPKADQQAIQQEAERLITEELRHRAAPEGIAHMQRAVGETPNMTQAQEQDHGKKA